ncbi:hypothetical protein COLO4_10414 [Corchorus olitorius]|uniref:F-box domain-containing protein n=1 Tax=Corchorus olitorius TaxID=93759 RepID=A0A1R3K8W4_9ROSI|nr:hypothetical protein COLO4_10414 [Corchorus olitorius]
MCIVGKIGLDSFIPRGNDCCPWSKLCDDLVAEILCRLPAKNLIRSKCVCKLWNRLVTDVCAPKFSTYNLLGGFFYQGEKNAELQHGFYLEYASCGGGCPTADERVVESLSALLPFKFTFEDLLHSCNGLLLFVTGSVPQYYVCNPLTKQCIEIPRNIEREKLAIDAGKKLHCFAALAFNPCESSHYKVVSFNYWTTYSSNKTVNIDVFSSGTGEWVSHTMPLDAPVYELPWNRHVVYLNGVLYRLTRSKYLLQFDLNNFSARAMEVPRRRDVIHNYGFVGVSCDRLHYSNLVGRTLFVWFLEDRGKVGSWVLKHSISVDDLYNNYKFGCPLIKCPRATFARLWALDTNSEAIYFGFSNAILRYHVDCSMLEVVYTPESGKEIYLRQYSLFAYSPCVVILKGIPNALQANYK